MSRPLQIALVGSGHADPKRDQLAFDVGRLLAAEQAILVCGGRGGVMAAGCRGAFSTNGTTVGILPAGKDDPGANRWLSIVVASGIGQARNLAVVLSADAVIAIGGGWGTLSEIALARKHEIPVILLASWMSSSSAWQTDPALVKTDSPAAAVERALALARDQAGT